MDRQILSKTLQKIIPPITNIEEKAKSEWKLIFSTIILNFILPNITIFSYGVILLIKVEYDEKLSVLILAPIVSRAISLCLDSCFREASETWGKNLGIRKLNICGISLTFFGILLLVFIKSPISYIFIFGIFCGVGVSLTLNQANFVMTEVFCENIRFAQLINSFGEAMGQFLMPFIIWMIFDLNGSQMGYLTLSALVLQTLPVSLFIKINDESKLKAPKRIRTYSTYSRVSSVSDDYTISNLNDIQIIELLMKNRKSLPNEYSESSDCNNIYEKEDKILSEINNQQCCTSQCTQTLEKIDEEEEEEEKCQQEDNVSGENDNQNNINVNRKYFKQFYKLKCNLCTVNPSQINNYIKHRMNSFQNTVIIPSIKSLKMLKFYPALLLRTFIVFIPLCNLSLLPLMRNELNQNVNTAEATFLLLVHALGWSSFIFTSPWTLHMSKSKHKYFLLFGFILSFLGLFGIMMSFILIITVLSSLIIGFGHGAIMFGYKATLRKIIGVQQWSKIRNTLDQFAAINILLLGLILNFILQEYGIRYCFGLLLILQGTSILILVYQFVINDIKKKFFSV